MPLINMSRRQVVWVLPAVAVAASVAPAIGEEMPLNTEENCRECGGIGVTPCECWCSLCVAHAGAWWVVAAAAGPAGREWFVSLLMRR